MAVWRLQTNTENGNISHFCIEHHVAAAGWSLKSLSEAECQAISNFSDFSTLASSCYRAGSFSSVRRLAEEVQPGDLIWMRSEGRYFFARVKENSRWRFDCRAREIDAANQLTDIDWYPASAKHDYADESSVPGAVATSFIKGSTFQRIRKDGIEPYSQMLFNTVHDSSVDPYQYTTPELYLNQSCFYSMLQPSDLEDLLCMWLYEKYHYICIPSTNKIATPKYECVLLDPSTGKHIYIQAKKGNTNLDAADYRDLKGDVYLLTTEGTCFHSNEYSNVHEVAPSDLYAFAQKQSSLVPENILYWISFLSEVEAKVFGQIKGIMFDTNISYSSVNESEMLHSNAVRAFGNSMKFVNSFRKGDFVLYYSKGKGIVAVGEIVSEQPEVIPEGLSHCVHPIVPESFSDAVNCPQYISPREIKKMLGRDFYWASTIKTPFLDKKQTDILIEALRSKYK